MAAPISPGIGSTRSPITWEEKRGHKPEVGVWSSIAWGPDMGLLGCRAGPGGWQQLLLADCLEAWALGRQPANRRGSGAISLV